MTADLETLSIDTIRCLAMDAVQKANAGHPGTAMALAPVAYVLFRERMSHDPADPHWVADFYALPCLVVTAVRVDSYSRRGDLANYLETVVALHARLGCRRAELFRRRNVHRP